MQKDCWVSTNGVLGGGKGTNLEVDQPIEKTGDEIWSICKWRGEDGDMVARMNVGSESVR